MELCHNLKCFFTKCGQHHQVLMNITRQHSKKIFQDLRFFKQAESEGNVVQLKKSDIAEFLSSGGTKGGQKANRTHNIVTYLHKPTGVTAMSKDTRQLPDNREFAMMKLRINVDVHLKGDESVFIKKQKSDDENRQILNQRSKNAANLQQQAKLKLNDILNKEDDLKY